MNDTFFANASRLLPRPRIVIGQVHEKILDGLLADEASPQVLRDDFDGLLRAADKDWGRVTSNERTNFVLHGS